MLKEAVMSETTVVFRDMSRSADAVAVVSAIVGVNKKALVKICNMQKSL